MFSQWQIARPLTRLIAPVRLPLLASATGGFPVPGGIPLAELPQPVRQSLQRLSLAQPKPSVSLLAMSEAQASMISPDLLPVSLRRHLEGVAPV